jgi:23S rRNA pseudouridine2605 synthase
MEERLQKIISRYGVASRRKAEELIEERRVRVNGNTASLGDTAVDGEDVIEVDGKPLGRNPARVYVMLNKPRGYVTTLQDEQGRKTVAELVEGCGARVYPVGRLDLYSEGLLLLTNDGELANRLMHPKNEVEKTYLLWVSDYTPESEEKLRSPVEIDGRRTSPAGIKKLKAEGSLALFEVTIHEGRNRQIRRMCEAAGLTPTRLKRIAEGPLRLGDLQPGKWRMLTGEEREALMQD